MAGIFDELGLGEAIDRMIPQESEKRIASVGQAVKAMGAQWAGVCESARLLVAHFSRISPQNGSSAQVLVRSILTMM
ncbi:MAG: DUF4277 domain-containing protein [Gammaproteobacteria bacterium]